MGLLIVQYQKIPPKRKWHSFKTQNTIQAQIFLSSSSTEDVEVKASKNNEKESLLMQKLCSGK